MRKKGDDKSKSRKANREDRLLRPDFSIEKTLVDKGFSHVGGVDEAGRGALAGPLSVSIVVFSKETILSSFEGIPHLINDSKLLTPFDREDASSFIKEKSLYYRNILIPHGTVDSLNVNGATAQAIRQLIKEARSAIPLDYILIDGNFRFCLEIPCVSVVKGDRKSISIAAASIISKITRDGFMDEIHNEYSGFNFRKNKGYGTKEHLEMITKMGICPIHRRSYEPVRSLLENGLFTGSYET